LDFEYSNFDYRGIDLASYINESMMNYDIDTSPYFDYNDSLFPDFQNDQNWVCEMLEIYLRHFYQTHL
jgi:thiamine kinase-like enzyme